MCIKQYACKSYVCVGIISLGKQNLDPWCHLNNNNLDDAESPILSDIPTSTGHKSINEFREQKANIGDEMFRSTNEKIDTRFDAMIDRYELKKWM